MFSPNSALIISSNPNEAVNPSGPAPTIYPAQFNDHLKDATVNTSAGSALRSQNPLQPLNSPNGCGDMKERKEKIGAPELQQPSNPHAADSNQNQLPLISAPATNNGASSPDSGSANSASANSALITPSGGVNTSDSAAHLHWFDDNSKDDSTNKSAESALGSQNPPPQLNFTNDSRGVKETESARHFFAGNPTQLVTKDDNEDSRNTCFRFTPKYQTRANQRRDN